MTEQVLVAYATKHGSTAEIAQIIAGTLRGSGLDVQLSHARDVVGLDDVGAVLLGSAVYHGRWQSDAIDFIKRFERQLGQRPTWLFSSGPTGGSPDSDALVEAAHAAPEAAAPVRDVGRRAAQLGVRGHATFGGHVGPAMTGLLERWMPRGDWRDVDQIRDWARGIASDLSKAKSEATR